MRVYYSIEEAREGAGLSCKTHVPCTLPTLRQVVLSGPEDTQAHREVKPYRVSAALVQLLFPGSTTHRQFFYFFNI